MSGVALHTFGPFALDAAAFRLTNNGEPVAAAPRCSTSFALLDHPPTLVTKEELFRAAWPEVIVSDNALTQAVSQLRLALHDDPANPTYVQTVARRACSGHSRSAVLTWPHPARGLLEQATRGEKIRRPLALLMIS